MGSSKKGKKNARRPVRRKLSAVRPSDGEGERASAKVVAQEDQQEKVGAVQVVLDNTVPGGFRMEPVCR